MTTRRDAQFEPLQDMGTRNLRRDSDDDEPIQTVGYIPGTGRTRAIPGDEDFPYFKDVPEVVGPFDLISYFPPAAPSFGGAVLPLVTDPSQYLISPEIDVRGKRLLVLGVSYIPSADPQLGAVGVLSIIPQQQLLPIAPTFPAVPPPPGTDVGWGTMGVVNPTLNVPAIAPGYAFRNVYDTELRFDPFTGNVGPFPAPSPNAPYSLSLSFDVSVYRTVRFRFGDLVGATSQVAAQYFLQR